MVFRRLPWYWAGHLRPATIVEGELAKAASVAFERGQQWSGIVLRQRQSAGAPYGIGQMQMPAVTQGVFRHTCRRANATGQAVRSTRHAQQFALRLDDCADQGRFAGCDVHSRRQEALLAEC